jgi:hypothetical protein
MASDLMDAGACYLKLLTYLPDNDATVDEAKAEFHMAWHRLVGELIKVARTNGAARPDAH